MKDNMNHNLVNRIDRLGNSTISIRIDVRTAVVLTVAALLTVYYARQFAVLALASYELVRNIHWNLVAAPFEAAVNQARAEHNGE